MDDHPALPPSSSSDSEVGDPDDLSFVDGSMTLRRLIAHIKDSKENVDVETLTSGGPRRTLLIYRQASENALAYLDMTVDEAVSHCEAVDEQRIRNLVRGGNPVRSPPRKAAKIGRTILFTAVLVNGTIVTVKWHPGPRVQAPNVQA